MSYTEADIQAYVPAPCPGCGHPVRQDWCEITEPEPDPDNPGGPRWKTPREYLPGRWYCDTRGCEHGPPLVPDGCTCPAVDITTLGDVGSRYLLGYDRACPVHLRPVPPPVDIWVTTEWVRDAPSAAVIVGLFQFGLLLVVLLLVLAVLGVRP